MARKITLIILLAMLAGTLAAGTAARAAQAEALEYLKGRQNEDGGFSEPDAASDPRTTCWVLLAASGAGEKPLEWTKSGAKPAEFLVKTAPQLSAAEDLELLIMAVSSAGGDPRNAEGVNLVSILQSGIAPDGKLGADIRQHCLGMIALASAGETVPQECAKWLLGKQRADGGWGESDKVLAADTAVAVEALVATEEGVQDRLDRAMNMLHDRINPDGGFTGPSQGSDAQTTATVVRAINAVGQDPSSDRWSFQGNNPAAYLKSLQAPDGHFQYAKGVESQPVMTTSMVIPALSDVHFPLNSDDTAQGDSSQNPVLSAGAQGSGSEGSSGAGLRSGGSSGAPGETLGRAGAVARAGGGLGLWTFIGICGAYLLILLAAVVAAGWLAEHAKARNSEPVPAGPMFVPGAW